MSVVIDNESGRIVGEFDKPKKKRSPKKRPLVKRGEPRVSPMVQSDLDVALGAAQRIFDTADHIARIIGGKR